MNDWNAIETAPKDGTPILVLSRTMAPLIRVCVWRKDPSSMGWALLSPHEDYPFTDSEGYWMYVDDVTDWMPLPKVTNG